MNQGWHYDGENPSSYSVSAKNDTGKTTRGRSARSVVFCVGLLAAGWFILFGSTPLVALEEEPSGSATLIWVSADKDEPKPKKKTTRSTDSNPYVFFTPGSKTAKPASKIAPSPPETKSQIPRVQPRPRTRQATNPTVAAPLVKPATKKPEPRRLRIHQLTKTPIPSISPQPRMNEPPGSAKIGHWQTTVTPAAPRQVPRSILRENPFRKLLSPKSRTSQVRTANASSNHRDNPVPKILRTSGTSPPAPQHTKARPVHYIAPPPRDPDMQLQVELVPSPPKPSSSTTPESTVPSVARRDATYISGPTREPAVQPQESQSLTVPRPPTMPIEPIPDPQPSTENSLMKGLRLPHLPELPTGLGMPKPNAQTLEKYSKFVVEENDPDNTLTLVVGRPKVLRFTEAPLRTYMPEAGSKIIAMRYVEPESGTHVAIEPLQTGSTVMSMWFRDEEAPDGQRYLSWLVNVVEDPERGRRLETIYASLEKEINRNFPDSVVRLSLVGDKLLVRGQAKDIEDATQILRIIGANAPGGAENVALRNVDMNLISQLSPSGDNAFDDGALQSLMLRTAEKDAVEAGSTVINMLRVAGEQQVMLKVIVAEVNRNALRAIGAKMTAGPTDFLSAFAKSGSGRSSTSNILAAEGGTFGINHGDFQLTLNALRQLGYAKTLAEPNVVSLNGQAAVFRAGDTFPVPAANVGSNGAVGQTVSQQFVGVQIRFLPVVTDKDRVRLQLAGTVSALDSSLTASVGGSNVPGTSTRNFFTTVEMREGQTLALAGLISTSSQAESSRTPFAGDMPVIGRLFNTDSVVAQEQELLILVTPQLVHPLDPDEELPLPGSNVFEPDDLEFYFHGRLEGSGKKVFRSAIRTSWERIRAHRRAERRLIIGPTGYSDRQ